MEAQMQLKFPFVSNYPHYQENTVTLMPTPERVGAVSGFTGRGVTMAFVDSGFSNHPDIADRIRLHVDASTQHLMEQPRVLQTGIASWHGQMTSVIAAGNGHVSGGKYRGIAPDANLILIKVSTPDFRIKEPDILRGLRWIYNTRHRHGIRIVNVSVGGDFPTNNPDNPLHRIVRQLTNAGIVVVIAAGNRGRDTLVPPASSPEAIVVGGYDDQNTLDREAWTCFHHNYGSAHDGSQKPDLLAPANWLASPLLPDSETAAEVEVLARLLRANSEDEVMKILQTGYDTLQLTEPEIEVMDFGLYQKLQERIFRHKVIDAHHQHVDGTSVAAPIVSAVIARMLEANPTLSVRDIRNILTLTANPEYRFPAHRQGAGLLNAAQAVQLAVAKR